MTLLAYAVRRTIGAAIVLFIVVLLGMFAVGSADRAPIRSLPEHAFGRGDTWTHNSENWRTFPVFALGMLALALTAVVLRRRLAR